MVGEQPQVVEDLPNEWKYRIQCRGGGIRRDGGKLVRPRRFQEVVHLKLDS